MGKTPRKTRSRQSPPSGGRTKRSSAGHGRRKGSVTREYLEALLVAIAIALFIRTFLLQAFKIPSGSMQDTLFIGDFLLADKITYGPMVPFTNVRVPGLRDPAVGDVLIFEYPLNPDRDFIKRCVAVSGQTIEVRDKVLFVDGRRTADPPFSMYTDPRILPRNSPNSERDNYGPRIVPEGHLFVMGDNRDNSEDSRYWGFLPVDAVKAKARVLYWSWAPDPEAPEFSGILSLPSVFFYNLLHFPERVRWTRIGSIVR